MHNAQCTIEVSAFGGRIGSFALQNLAVSKATSPIRAYMGSQNANYRRYRGGERPNGHIIAEGDTIIVHCALCIGSPNSGLKRRRNMEINKIIAAGAKLRQEQVDNAVSLLDEGHDNTLYRTIPQGTNRLA